MINFKSEDGPNVEVGIVHDSIFILIDGGDQYAGCYLTPYEAKQIMEFLEIAIKQLDK